MTDERKKAYPFSGQRYIYKTMMCRLDEQDVSSNKAALDELFRQYASALEVFRHLMRARSPERTAFCKEDMAAAKAVAPGLTPGIRTAALDKAIEMWRSYQSQGGRGGIPSGPKTGSGTGKGTASAQGPARPATIRMPRTDYYIVPVPDLGGGTANRSFRVSIPTPKGAVLLGVMGEDHQAHILESIIDRKNGLVRCVGELLWRPSGLCLDIHFGHEAPRDISAFPLSYGQNTNFVPIGVDLGIHNLLVAVALGKGAKGVLFIKGGRWREGLRRFQKAQDIHNELGRNKLWAASREAQGHFVRDVAHKAARELIELAKTVVDRARSEVPVIVLEDLVFEDITKKGGTKDGPALGHEQATELRLWPFGIIRDLIIEKAAWDGVPVMVVRPAGTSIACPRCGSPDAVRRRDVHRLVCPNCTYKADDDYCAALNIAKRGFERLQNDRTAAFGRPSAGPVHHQSHKIAWVNSSGDGGAACAPRGTGNQMQEGALPAFAYGTDAKTSPDQGRSGGHAYFGER